MAATTPIDTLDLLAFIDASPTAYHCAAEARERLRVAGFQELHEAAAWALEPGRGYFVTRGGALAAFRVGHEAPHEAGFRVLGAHTDSPHLRLKPQPDVRRAGYLQLGVEVYGGMLEYTWLDRDLGLAGRVFVREPNAPTGAAPRLRMVDIRRPLLRVPSLAIHLNRELRDTGLSLDRQKHMPPVLGLAPAEGVDSAGLAALLGDELDVSPDAIVGSDLAVVDVVPPVVGGLRGEFIFAPRLDNQAMSHAALAALTTAAPGAATTVAVLYDHEEVGSGSTTGAAGPLAETLLERLVEQRAGDRPREAFARAMARARHVSADMAHAVHPNYEDRHEPQHRPAMNAGPVVKVNAQQRYATSGESAAWFEAACRDADVPFQRYVNRTDLPCGSTIGPLAATRLGLDTVDVGNPMLSMHSIREQAGVQDHPWMIAAMKRFLET